MSPTTEEYYDRLAQAHRDKAAEYAATVKLFRSFGYYAAANRIDDRRKVEERLARIADKRQKAPPDDDPAGP